MTLALLTRLGLWIVGGLVAIYVAAVLAVVVPLYRRGLKRGPPPMRGADRPIHFRTRSRF